MKSDEDVRMISAEAPVLFAKVPGHAWVVRAHGLARPLLGFGAGPEKAPRHA
jgi:hypothetical protein